MSAHDLFTIGLSGAGLAISLWNLRQLRRSRRELDALEARVLATVQRASAKRRERRVIP